MIHVARPRDYRVAGGSKPSCRGNDRPVREGSRADQWVVDCYDNHGVEGELWWKWTHYGEKSMNKRQAKRMAKLCQRIQDDLDAKKAERPARLRARR